MAAPGAAAAEPGRRGEGPGWPRASAPEAERPAPRELVRPSVTELSRAVRTNILCTVPGCGKVLPNSPALSMHLSKAHRVQDGKINASIRKGLKTTQKFYCCPIEGCPRGPNRPFSQFSLVKQHFMKMHAEKKHKCDKCSNSYGTEWDLKRHIEDCGKTFQCTCGCPYASRTALLSHVYRTGHEIPAEHRDPPSKKRKMCTEVSNQHLAEKASEAFINARTSSTCTQELESSEMKLMASFEGSCSSNISKQTLSQPKCTPKMLLPKPKVALVKLPVMQFAQLPIFVSATDSSVKSVVVAVDNQGSVMNTVHLLPQSIGILIPALEAEALVFKDTVPISKTANSGDVEPVSTSVQVNLGKVTSNTVQELGSMCHKNKISSINVQTDLSYISQNFMPAAAWTPDSSVSSCSQTDLTFSSQVSLPVSVQTQTLLPSSKLTSSIAAQTDAFAQACFQSCGVSRETQTNRTQNSIDGRVQMDQAVMCNDIFDSVHSAYDVSTQIGLPENNLMGADMDQRLLQRSNCKTLSQDTIKSEPIINFNTQTNILPQQNMTDNQTQTMDLLSDLENIFSGNMSGQTLDNRGLLSDTSSGADTHLPSGPTQSTGIDFDIEEFFSASNIQTQTEESELGNLNSEPVLESLDIETQTDLFFSDSATQSYSCRGNSNFLGLEMFDTQTQTDLNSFLDSSTHLPLGSILKQSSFSMSTDSSDTETQTEIPSAAKNIPSQNIENKVQLNSAETQTMDSCFETLGSLFLTSNETQTAMDDFLLADLAWNTMESQFSSVETQTCAELCSLVCQKFGTSH
ncbi:ATM interactor [Platysternon megacephalum]|uniref:ATM interactor n=1 Tax=Platysternon megacephalum TaxID=55544 RepID=A0A4D9EDP5_9SAUR|nr:ATM interactor [Platysternon megacephalum]